MESIGAWLERLGLGQYTRVFEENDLDPEIMPEITEADLSSLGVSLGHRKKILAAVRMPLDAPPPDRRPDGGERRQLTVMFCDLVGFTALAEQLDPEEVREIVAAYQRTVSSIVDELSGHVAQLLGDGVMVYFGHPRAHEDDAERAVRAGLRIVERLAASGSVPPLPADLRLEVRVGIDTGVTVVAGMGDSTRQETLALGDTPNIAARLQGLAAPGTVVISEHTRRLLPGSFDLADLGPKQLKGISKPVRVWSVAGLGSSVTRFEAATRTGLSAFVGREQETTLIDECWSLAAEGRGQVILLSGEAGIGKSRIIEEARRRLLARGARALRLQCSPFHEDSPYHPIARALARFLGFERDDSNADRYGRLRSRVVEGFGRPETDAALLASVLSIEVDEPPDVALLPPLRRKRETIRALSDFVEAVTTSGPTLVLFEDAHWSDPTSLEVLDTLVERAPSLGVLIIVACRPGFRAPWQSRDHVAVRSLARLTPSESEALVSRVTGGMSLPPGLAHQIIEKSDGIPLFVEELTKFLLESDQLTGGDGAFEYSVPTREASIPASLRDSLMARLDRHQHVKRIAQIGATIGRDFSYELIHAIAGMSTETLDRSLADLLDAGLAMETQSLPDAVYSFKHALVQEVAYESLLKTRRQELHSAIVTALEARGPEVREARPELLARHLSEAGQVEAALPYWRAAADLSLSRMAVWEATSQLNRGLALVQTLPPSDDRDQAELPFHALLGTAHVLARGWGATEVEVAYQRANELRRSVANVDDTIWASWGIWVFHHVRGEIEFALEIARDLHREVEEAGGRAGKLVASMMLGQSTMYAAVFEESREHLASSHSLYDEKVDHQLINVYSTDLRLVVDVHQALTLWILGFPDQASALCRQNHEHAASLNHPYSHAWALTWGALPLLLNGETNELVARVGQGLAIAEEFGFAYTAAIGSILHGWGRAELGELDAGVAEMRAGLEDFEATGAKIVVPFFKCLLARLLGRASDHEAGLTMLEEAATQISRWGERWAEAEVHRVRGELLFERNRNPHDFLAAEESFRAALDLALRQGSNSWALRTSLSLGRLLEETGRGREGRALVQVARSRFSEGFSTPDLEEARAFQDSADP